MVWKRGSQIRTSAGYSKLDNSTKKVSIAETEPLAKMYVHFEGNFISELDGKDIIAPAIFIRYLLDKDLTEVAKQASVHQLNIALLFVGGTSIYASILEMANGASKTASIIRLASGILDLGTIAIGDVCSILPLVCNEGEAVCRL